MANFKSIITGIWHGFQAVEKVAEPIAETLLPQSKPIFTFLDKLDPIVGNIASNVVAVEATAADGTPGLDKFQQVLNGWRAYEATFNSILAVEGKKLTSDDASFTAGTNALVEALRQYAVFRASIRIVPIAAPAAPGAK